MDIFQLLQMWFFFSSNPSDFIWTWIYQISHLCHIALIDTYYLPNELRFTWTYFILMDLPIESLGQAVCFMPKINFIFFPIVALWNLWLWNVIQQIKKLWTDEKYKFYRNIDRIKLIQTHSTILLILRTLILVCNPD